MDENSLLGDWRISLAMRKSYRVFVEYEPNRDEVDGIRSTEVLVRLQKRQKNGWLLLPRSNRCLLPRSSKQSVVHLLNSQIFSSRASAIPKVVKAIELYNKEGCSLFLLENFLCFQCFSGCVYGSFQAQTRFRSEFPVSQFSF